MTFVVSSDMMMSSLVLSPPPLMLHRYSWSFQYDDHHFCVSIYAKNLKDARNMWKEYFCRQPVGQYIMDTRSPIQMLQSSHNVFNGFMWNIESQNNAIMVSMNTNNLIVAKQEWKNNYNTISNRILSLDEVVTSTPAFRIM